MSLRGKLVVITRSSKGSRQWEQLLRKHGAKVYNLPTIAMSPLPLAPKLIAVLQSISTYDWLVFTSANGLYYLQSFLNQLGPDSMPLAWPEIAVIADQTAAAVRAAGLKASFRPSVPTSQALGEELEPVEGKRVLLLRTTLASHDLAEQLQKRGAMVTDQAIYQTSYVTDEATEFSGLLKTRSIDFLTFASSSAVMGLQERLSRTDLEIVRSLPVVAIGDSVAKSLRDIHFTDVHIADQPTPDAVVEKLEQLSQTPKTAILS